MPIENNQYIHNVEKKFPKTSRGFSLLEMAIVLAIVGLLMAGLIPSISSQIDQQHRSETRKLMDEIKDSLYGFAITTGHLPCPASQVSGIEDRNSSTSACNSRVGFLPWATLGVNQTDGWGRLFRYSATPAFTAASSVFSISTAADITIQNLDGSSLSVANDIPVAIVSHGANGIYGTMASGGTMSTTSPTSYSNVLHQQNNVDGSGNGRIFFSADITARTASNDEDFDDQVGWISKNILINRMVTAGKLP